jgi:eukaryotic-like serine/threonine-protein kinase
VNGLIQQGYTLRMQRGDAEVVVEERLGEGSQGVVHRARLGGAQFAVKWIRPGWGEEEMRKSITELIRRGKPPHEAFVWPIDLVGSDLVAGFGYVMPLLEPRFTSLAPMLRMDVLPSFRGVAAIARDLVDAFHALHSSGLCYRDVSFGNLRVDRETCEVAIIDVDNVGVDGERGLVKGTGPFMAPEILRNEAFPSTATDLHSLAVMLFYLLMRGHPLEGMRADSSYTWEHGHLSDTQLLVRNFGVHPLFIFDPDDPSNRPVPGHSVSAWWPAYPLQIRKVFTRAFTRGLHDASLDGRVLEGTWRRALLALHDSVATCASCGVPVYYDLELTGQRCWGCHQLLPAPATLKLPGGTLVLSEGAIVNSHHLHRDREYQAVRAVVERHPGRPGRVVLRNMTDQTWTVHPDGEDPKVVAPNQRLGVRSMQITIGTVQGRISCGSP